MNKFYKKIKFNKPFGIYIHIPFCISKCGYCDFYSEVYRKEELNLYINKFIKNLKKEIEFHSQLTDINTIKTIYVGGGTPSLLSPVQIKDLINHISHHFSTPSTGEISMESNPASLTKEKLRKYKEAGITRLSLGIQSLNNEELEKLGRVHTAEKAEEIIKNIKTVFDNFNLDLIFALPEQSLKDWKNTLIKVLKFQPPHLSIYNLQLEPETPLFTKVKRGELSPISEEKDLKMFNKALELVKKAGYQHYEISNFAKKGCECSHNIIYWKLTPYLGLGPAASSFDGQNRFNNYSDLSKYISNIKNNKLPLASINKLTLSDLMTENMIMGLRLIKGVSKNNFRKKFANDIKDIYGKEIKHLKEMELIKENQKRISLTQKGLRLGNRVFKEFI